MVAANAVARADEEALAAELTAAAYAVALRHGLRGPFLDIELDLWRELRRVLDARRADVAEVVAWAP